MSAKESCRVFVLEQAIKGKITNRQAAEVVGLSERQVICLKERMKVEGVAGLAHKNRGRTPKHAVPKSLRKPRQAGLISQRQTIPGVVCPSTRLKKRYLYPMIISYLPVKGGDIFSVP